MQTSSRKLTLKVCGLVALAVGGLVAYGFVSSRLLFRWLALPTCFLGGYQGVTHPKTEYLGAVLDCASRELSDIEGLHFVGQGLSSEDGAYKYIDVKLALRGRSLEKERVRLIIVRLQRTLIDCINNYPDSDQFFARYPVGLEQVHITLFLSDEDGTVFIYPAVAVASSRCGIVKYCACNSTELGPYDYKETESWEEAVRIVEGDSGCNAD